MLYNIGNAFYSIYSKAVALTFIRCLFFHSDIKNSVQTVHMGDRSYRGRINKDIFEV